MFQAHWKRNVSSNAPYCSYSNYHGRASFSYISMQLLASRILKKQKVGSARRVSLFNFLRWQVHPRSSATFSPLRKTLTRSAVSTRSTVGKSMHGRGVESRWLGQRDHLFSHINARFSLSGWKCDFKSNLRCALVQFWNHAYETGSWSLWVSAPCSSIGDVSKWICWLGAVITRLKFDPVPHHDYLFLYFRVGNMRNFIFWHFIIVNKKRGKKAS